MNRQGRNQPDQRQSLLLPFRAINRPGRPGYVAGLQRHHLIPRAIAVRACFGPMFEAIAASRLLDDFRSNGILLPASEAGAVRMGLPLHRGPHRDYSAMVAERIGAIEGAWSIALEPRVAVAALTRLQADLRRELFSTARSWRLNSRDPLGCEADFAHLDAIAERLWVGTQPVYGRAFSESAAIAA